MQAVGLPPPSAQPAATAPRHNPRAAPVNPAQTEKSGGWAIALLLVGATPPNEIRVAAKDAVKSFFIIVLSSPEHSNCENLFSVNSYASRLCCQLTFARVIVTTNYMQHNGVTLTRRMGSRRTSLMLNRL
jgi:hypothetical protein